MEYNSGNNVVYLSDARQKSLPTSPVSAMHILLASMVAAGDPDDCRRTMELFDLMSALSGVPEGERASLHRLVAEATALQSTMARAARERA